MPARIVTLTVNPAVDLATQAKSVQPGHKIRTFGERYDAGGGGINVARVISELGGETLALFASGGVTGRFVEEMLTKAKVPWQAIQIQGACRISVTVRDQSSGQEYRFVPQGPELTSSDCANILATLSDVEADWVVASGSLPPGTPSDFYGKAAGIVSARGAIRRRSEAVAGAWRRLGRRKRRTPGPTVGTAQVRRAAVEALLA
jgi:6-phosphofructokinase 2